MSTMCIRSPLPFPTRTCSDVGNYDLIIRLLRLGVRWFVAVESGYQLVSFETSSLERWVVAIGVVRCVVNEVGNPGKMCLESCGK